MLNNLTYMSFGYFHLYICCRSVSTSIILVSSNQTQKKLDLDDVVQMNQTSVLATAGQAWLAGLALLGAEIKHTLELSILVVLNRDCSFAGSLSPQNQGPMYKRPIDMRVRGPTSQEAVSLLSPVCSVGSPVASPTSERAPRCPSSTGCSLTRPATTSRAHFAFVDADKGNYGRPQVPQAAGPRRRRGRQHALGRLRRPARRHAARTPTGRSATRSGRSLP
jgi:hypothetical protein